jgi:ATP-dependent Clp protease ATP-binding subunit ClpX
MFELDGIELEFEEDGLELVAEKVKELRTNARGLKSILEKILIPYQFDAINLVDRGLTKIIINRSSVAGGPAIMIFDKKQSKNEQ